MNSNKPENYLITSINILISLYFIILAFYSRPHFDDLHFMWQTRDNGLIDFISFNYMEWSGRFVAYFIVGLVDLLQYKAGGNLFFPFLFGLIGFAITYHTLKKVLNLNNWFQFNLALLFYWIYIYTTFDFAAFNWYCAMSYFLIGPVHLLFIYHINNKNKFQFKNLIILLLISLFLGAGYEGYTPIVFMVSAFNLAYLLNKANWKLSALADIRIKKLLFYNSLILLFFALVIIAPGNYVRMNSLNEFKVSLSAVQFAVAVTKATGMFAYFSFFNIFYYLIIFLLSGYFSIKYRSKVASMLVSNKQLVLIAALFVVLVVANTLIPVYLWGDFGVYRHYIPLNFIAILLVAYLGLHAGYLYGEKIQDKSKWQAFTALAMIAVVTLFNLTTDIPSAKAYAKEVDDRINYLQKVNASGFKGTLQIKPIQNMPYTFDTKYVLFRALGKDQNRPVLYYISDVDTNVVDYGIHIRKLYKLNFDIIRQDVN